MKFTVRKATEKDFPAVMTLVKGLAHFQGKPEMVTNTVEQMKAEQSYFECLVAEDELQQIQGVAIYFFSYSTWVGKSIFLDDLFVKATARGQKIGSHLLNALFEEAKRSNCKRVRWQVSHWNTKALEFYKKIGASISDEEHTCDFEKEALQGFYIAV